MVKSIIRIIGFSIVLLEPEAIVAAAACLLIAEILSIVEEFEDRLEEK